MPDQPDQRPIESLSVLTAEHLARFFHERYEALAPQYSYLTRPESAVAWEDVPTNNRKLMVAVCREVLDNIFGDPDTTL